MHTQVLAWGGGVGPNALTPGGSSELKRRVKKGAGGMGRRGLMIDRWGRASKKGKKTKKNVGYWVHSCLRGSVWIRGLCICYKDLRDQPPGGWRGSGESTLGVNFGVQTFFSVSRQKEQPPAPPPPVGEGEAPPTIPRSPKLIKQPGPDYIGRGVLRTPPGWVPT